MEKISRESNYLSFPEREEDSEYDLDPDEKWKQITFSSPETSQSMELSNNIIREKRPR